MFAIRFELAKKCLENAHKISPNALYINVARAVCAYERDKLSAATKIMKDLVDSDQLRREFASLKDELKDAAMNLISQMPGIKFKRPRRSAVSMPHGGERIDRDTYEAQFGDSAYSQRY